MQNEPLKITNTTPVDCEYNMVTYLGRYVNPAQMTMIDVEIQDIAHGLSMICRFSGQCLQFYSVAQHSRLVSERVMEATGNARMALTALLHDGSEAYLCDLVRCVKALCPDYRRLENIVQTVIYEKFHLELHPEGYLPLPVQQADMRMCVTERKQLISDQHRGWDLEKVYDPYPLKIKLEYPPVAKELFLESFIRLSSKL